jgi:peptidoglycan hydrolase-like protein with peptidoglycan-binding domain
VAQEVGAASWLHFWWRDKPATTSGAQVRTVAGYHTVVQGEYLSKIAKDNGFPDYLTIWDHPNNAQLKQQRQNPNVFYPGDHVFIPDKEQRHESGSTEKRHTFVVKKQTLKLRLVLEDVYEKPIAGARCALVVEDRVSQPTTDGTGKIQLEIPLDAQNAMLVVRSNNTPFQNIPIPIKIGRLDPVDKISGQIARLNNLGYFAGDIDQAQQASAATGNGSGRGGSGNRVDQASADQFRSAVEEFQCDHGLKVDGICGPVTQAKLKHAHGC